MHMKGAQHWYVLSRHIRLLYLIHSSSRQSRLEGYGATSSRPPVFRSNTKPRMFDLSSFGTKGEARKKSMLSLTLSCRDLFTTS